MTGKDIIKIIANENGYDKEYDFEPNKTNIPKAKKTYNNIDELLTFEVDAANNEVIMNVEDPIAARKYGLSDSYRTYIWDGDTMYFYKNPDESASWSISYGGGSMTMVAASVVKFRDTAAKKMIEYCAKSDKPIPEWMIWRVAHYKKGLPGLDVFER